MKIKLSRTLGLRDYESRMRANNLIDKDNNAPVEGDVIEVDEEFAKYLIKSKNAIDPSEAEKK